LCSRKHTKKNGEKSIIFRKNDDGEKKMKMEKNVKNGKRHRKKGMEEEDKHIRSL
jgi:hypothetical protein